MNVPLTLAPRGQWQGVNATLPRTAGATLPNRRGARLEICYLDGMGYELHITRGANWHDEAKEPITLDEWIAYVKSDPEMRLDGFAEATLEDGSVLRSENPSLAVWVVYSGDGVDGNHAWMWHFEGNVQAKSPDREIVAKMWRIAQALRARLVGDEGEEYGPDGKEIRPERPKSFWKRLFGR